MYKQQCKQSFISHGLRSSHAIVNLYELVLMNEWQKFHDTMFILFTIFVLW